MFHRLLAIWQLRHFWLTLARLDLKERYRRSFVGVAWSLVKPAVTVLIMTVVFTGVFDVSPREYVPFLFLGLVIWQFFAESVHQGCNAFRLGNTYLRVRPIPLAVFPLRVVLAAGIHASFGLAAGCIGTSILRGQIDVLPVLAILPALAVFLITAWSISCIVAILHTRYSDTQQIAEITLQVLFYATPVIYLPETIARSRWLRVLMECNPMASFLELVRQPLLHGEMPGASSVLVALVFMTVCVSVAAYCLHRVEKRLVLWL